MNSKPTNNTYSLVLSHFRKGRENGIHLQELEKITRLDNRTLRKVIEAIRRNGVCVCSDENGYYLPANADELERYIKRVNKTARSTFFTLQTARNELEKIQINKQLSLFSEDGVLYE